MTSMQLLDLISVEAFQDGVSVATAGTGIDGKFALIGLLPGSYDLKIEDANHQIYTAVADVFAGNETSTGDIILARRCIDISGVVTSDNGTLDINDDLIFEGAVVDLVDVDGNTIESVLTDINGEFSFPSVVIGQYEVIVNGDSHEEKITLFDESMEGPQSLSIIMNLIF